MPVTKSLTVETNNGRNGLRRGDVINIRGTSGVVVVVKELNTNLQITMDTEIGRTVRRVRMDQPINVLRSEPTDDEILAKQLAWLMRKVAEGHDFAKKNQAQVFKRMVDSYKDGVKNDHLYPFSLEQAADVSCAQVEFGIWRDVISKRDYLIEEKSLSPEWATALAVLAAKEQITAQLTGRYTWRALSRSTSTISNLVEDIEGEIKAKWLDEWRFSDLNDIEAYHNATKGDES